MIKKIKVIKTSETLDPNQRYSEDVIFKCIQVDTIGNSGSNPTWGQVYEYDEDGYLKFKGNGLYKEIDYDYPNNAYSEKIFSIIGQRVLHGARVPNIDVVQGVYSGHGIISHILLDNDKEDLIHVRDLLFNKYDRTEVLKRRSVFTIDDILESIKIQVPDEGNYKEIEKQLVQTILLDSVTNNSDRHPNNWALVRDKKTNHYDLAVFDNSAAFIGIFDQNLWSTVDGWAGSYIGLTDEYKRGTGLIGKELIKVIAKRFPKYYKEFSECFSKEMPQIAEKIKQENLPVNNSKVIHKMQSRTLYLERILSEGEIEYE